MATPESRLSCRDLLMPRARQLILIACTLLLVGAWGLWAQDGLLEIEPGDVLTIAVHGEQELSGDYAVGADGAVFLPLTGRVDVAGHSVAEVQVLIANRLGKYLKRPDVAVMFSPDKAIRRAFLTGYTQKTGIIPVPAGTTVAQAIAAAGGALPEGDLSRVAVTSRSGEVAYLDLSGLREPGRPVEQRVVRMNDIIHVPLSEDMIAVFGQVTRPGKYPLPERKVTALEAAAGQLMGGGVLPDGDLTGAFVLRRNQQIIHVNLERILREGHMEEDVELQPGDAVVVPLAGRISVLGAVVEPQTFATNEQITILDALGRVGGPTPLADLPNAALIRGKQRTPIDLDAMWRAGDISQNMVLKPGDVLIIPENENQVLVLGQITKPGAYPFTRNLKVLDVLALAGPVLPAADKAGARIIRASGQVDLDLVALLEDGDVTQNLPLQPQDAIVVPEADRVYIFGAVNKAGAVPYHEGQTLIELLAQAGGTRQEAALQRVRISRSGEYGAGELMQVDLRAVLEGGSPETAPEVQPGDIIFVPFEARKYRRTWQDFRDMVFTGIGLINAFR